MSDTRVTALSLTVVKGTRLRQVQSVQLGTSGVRGDRRFFVVDERDRMINGKQLGDLQSVVASFDEHTGELALEFPGEVRVEGKVNSGSPISAHFYSAGLDGTVLKGPWAEALSEHVGQRVRLVQTASAIDRGAAGAASLISRASLQHLAAEAGVEQLDARRFRMTIEVDGIEAHAEDGWIGRRFRIGEAEVHFEGNVGRCMITSRDPDTGVVDLPTLDLLGSYRRDLETTEPLPLGIYGTVLREGVVRVGDPVIAVDGRVQADRVPGQ